MKDTDLYSRILGLSDPWFVVDVALDTVGGRSWGRAGAGKRQLSTHPWTPPFDITRAKTISAEK